jgi:hypothetical protein
VCISVEVGHPRGRGLSGAVFPDRARGCAMRRRPKRRLDAPRDAAIRLDAGGCSPGGRGRRPQSPPRSPLRQRRGDARPQGRPGPHKSISQGTLGGVPSPSHGGRAEAMGPHHSQR